MNLCNNAEDGFVRISNNGIFYLYFEVAYTIGGRINSEDSQILNPSEIEEINIPGLAYNIKLKVFISSNEVVWNNVFQLTYEIPSDYCFEVSGRLTNPNIERIPCDALSRNFNCIYKR